MRYEVAVLAIPRCLFRIAHQTVRTVRAVPSLTTVLRELRDVAGHLERLATFAAAELPEIVYQLEKIREQLTAIERRLGHPGEVSPDEPQNCSRPPS